MAFAPGVIFGFLDGGGMVVDRNTGEYLPCEQVFADPLRIDQLDILDQDGRGGMKLGSISVVDFEDDDGEEDEGDDVTFQSVSGRRMVSAKLRVFNTLSGNARLTYILAQQIFIAKLIGKPDWQPPVAFVLEYIEDDTPITLLKVMALEQWHFDREDDRRVMQDVAGDRDDEWLPAQAGGHVKRKSAERASENAKKESIRRNSLNGRASAGSRRTISKVRQEEYGSGTYVYTQLSRPPFVSHHPHRWKKETEHIPGDSHGKFWSLQNVEAPIRKKARDYVEWEQRPKSQNDRRETKRRDAERYFGFAGKGDGFDKYVDNLEAMMADQAEHERALELADRDYQRFEGVMLWYEWEAYDLLQAYHNEQHSNLEGWLEELEDRADQRGIPTRPEPWEGEWLLEVVYSPQGGVIYRWEPVMSATSNNNGHDDPLYDWEWDEPDGYIWAGYRGPDNPRSLPSLRR